MIEKNSIQHRHRIHTKERTSIEHISNGIHGFHTKFGPIHVPMNLTLSHFRINSEM